MTAGNDLRKSSAPLVGQLIGRTPPATRCLLIPPPSGADPSPLPEQLPCQTAPATVVPLLSASPASIDRTNEPAEVPLFIELRRNVYEVAYHNPSPSVVGGMPFGELLFPELLTCRSI